jgi:hypothetical protein
MAYTPLKCNELHKHCCDMATSINSMNQTPSYDDNIRSAVRDILRSFMSPKVDYGVHKGPSMNPILGWFNPVHTTPLYFNNIHSDIALPSTHEFPTRITYVSVCVYIYNWRRVQIVKLFIMQFSSFTYSSPS